MHLEFSTAGRIVFGPGTIDEAIKTAVRWGKRVLMVIGTGNTHTEMIRSSLLGAGLGVRLFRVHTEPTLTMIQQGVAAAQEENVDLIIGIGGGSAIDAAKAIAGLVTNPGPVVDYLDVVGQGKSLANPGVPVIALPTTSGTGAEVTRNAVILVEEKSVKVSLRSPFLIPRLAVVDPLLTLSVPPDVTASTGMDALAQVIEPFVSTRNNPLVDSFCREGMKRIGRSIIRVFRDGEDREAREDMSFGSLMSGISLTNAGLGAVHGFAAPLGGMYRAPHGMICARLLAPVVRANLRVLGNSEFGHPAIEKYQEIEKILCRPGEDLTGWLENLCVTLRIPRLEELGVRRDDLELIASRAEAASSMQTNPVRLSRDDLIGILEECL